MTSHDAPPTLPSPHLSLALRIAAFSAEQQREFYEEFDEDERAHLHRLWLWHARPAQLPPPGAWRIWLMLAGRAFGKTRAGAEWIDALARQHHGSSIALVGATHDDVRNVMIEGESGIMNLPHRTRPTYQPSLKRLIWPDGAMATCFSAAEPESLRGPQHHFAWADEVARWGTTTGDGGQRGIAAWNNLMLGLRLGENPRIVATTTPRALPIIRTIMATPGVVQSGGSMRDNAANLSPAFIDAMQASFGATALGRQEIDGVLIDDVEGALWTRAMLNQCRRDARHLDEGALARVVVGVDPPASAHGDACGIIVAAELAPGAHPVARFAVLADVSVERASPQQWADAVALAARHWRADRIVAEANNGGDMVESVLRGADADLPVRLVRAARGKAARAEPVALRYSRGEVLHLGQFPQLEDELCGLCTGGAYHGPGRSPDRADALVWALAELTGRKRANPQIRRT